MCFEAPASRVLLGLSLCAWLAQPLHSRAEPAASADLAPNPDPEPARAVEPLPAPPSAPGAPAPASTAEPAPQDASQQRAQPVVARGEALFAAGNYDAALTEFERAYRLLEGHPRQYFVLHNLALCHERMFRYDLALPLYEDYLRRAPPGEGDRVEVEAVVRVLRGLLAVLDIDSNAAAEVWVDNRRIGGAPGRVLLPAGRHVVELRAPLYESARRELDVAARAHARLAFELKRLSTYAGPSPVYFWSGVGLTAAALVAGSVFGARALAARDDGVQEERLHLPSDAQMQSVKHRALAADLCFGAAALFGVTSAVLFFLTDFRGSEQPPHPAAAGTRLRLTARGLGGRF